MWIIEALPIIIATGLTIELISFFIPVVKDVLGIWGPIFIVMGASGWRMQGSSEYLIIAGVVVIVVRDIVLYCWMRRLEDR